METTKRSVGVCECGHWETSHEPSEDEDGVLVLVDGHGACFLCSCGRFTWDSFVDEKEANRG